MEIYNIDTIKDKISKQQYDTALDCLRKINITNVNRDDVNFCFGRAYFYLNQINNAEKYFLKIVKSKDIVIKDYSKFYLVKIFLINKRYTKVFNLLKTIENTEIKNMVQTDICKSILEIVQKFNRLVDYNSTKNFYNKFNRYFNNMDLSVKNRFLNKYELASKKTILSSKPSRLLIKLSNLCNLKCVMCSQKYETLQFLNQKIINIILDNISYYEEIYWQGGEPLILPYMKTILQKTLKYKHLKQTIISNFQVVSDELIELILKNNTDLIISIDSQNKSTYKKIRVGASFDKLIANINRLNYFIKSFKKNFFVTVNFVLIRENYKELVDMVYFIKKYNFKTLAIIKDSRPVGHKACFSDAEKQEIKILLDKAKFVAKDLGIDLLLLKLDDSKKDCKKNIIGENIYKKDRLFCHLPWYKLTISYDKTVSVDCFCKSNYKIDMNKVKTIEDIWNLSAFVKHRTAILKHDISLCDTTCRNLDYNYRYK